VNAAIPDLNTQPATATPAKSELPELPGPLREDLGVIEELIELGQHDAARRECRRLMDSADPETFALIARLAAAVALDRQDAWMPSYPADRDVRYLPPRELRTHWTARRAPGHEQARDGDVLAAAYLAERGGVDDTHERPERPVGYSLDYDLAAVPALRGTPCLRCHLERSNVDRARGDGLCQECRDAGHTRASVIQTRCGQIVAGTGEQAQGLLRQAWRRADPVDRQTIAAWVRANGAQITAAAR
jgi:hypothetical protein